MPDPGWAVLRQPCWGAPCLNILSQGIRVFLWLNPICVCLADIPLGMGVFPPQHVQAFGAFLFALEVDYPGTPVIVQSMAQVPSDLSSYPPGAGKRVAKVTP